MAPIIGRRLGNYERFSLSRSLIGVPPVVVFHATLPSRVSASAITVAVTTLLSQYPLLRCIIQGTKGRTPSYQENHTIKPEDVVRVVESEDAFGSPADLIVEGMVAGQAFDLEKGPLWRVTLYRKTGDDNARVAITLACSHVIADGSGVKGIFAELLKLLHTPVTEPGAPKTTLPPSLDATVDLRPSTLHRLRLAWSKNVAPFLPEAIRPILPPPFFPNPPATPPYLNPTSVKLITFAPTTVAGLKSAARARGLTAIHALLHTATLASITLADSSSDSSTPVHIVGCTPISVRDVALGHPEATGNYAIATNTSHSLLPSTPFWSTARNFALVLSSPQERLQAKWGRGMLRFLPDPALAKDATKTGWEEHLEAQAKSENPYSQSFEVSNLLLMTETGWEGEEALEELCWAQAAGAIGSGLAINVISARGGPLTVTVSWRKTSVPDEVVDRFCAGFEMAVTRLSSGDALSEDLTLSGLLCVE